MWEERKPRYDTKGRAHISGLKKNDILLKNLSVTGCCLNCAENIEEIKIGETYEIKIKPEKASHTGEFEFHAECKWIRAADLTYEIGFSITASPKGRHFQNYVNYITYQTTAAKQ